MFLVKAMEKFKTLYLDMNSFYASVEQHINPALRGKAVGITAMEGEQGCVVAASYEAKQKGVKVPRSVKEAKILCPDIVLLPSRHRLYVRYNQRIAMLLDHFLELERIRSIDEFQFILSGKNMYLEQAMKTVEDMRQALAQEFSPAIKFSAGIGPNHLLAKIAGKLQKPAGMAWLSTQNMPHRLSHLKLDDLPGISRGVLARLNHGGIFTIADLYALDPKHARNIWHSVEGERFVRALHGEDIPLRPTKNSGYGNSKILMPENRTVKNAYLVSKWLIEKASRRLRRDGYVAKRFSLYVKIIAPNDIKYFNQELMHYTQDTRMFMQANHRLWQEMWQQHHPQKILAITIHLGDVIKMEERVGELFMPLEPGKPNKFERLFTLTDRINRRYGDGAVTLGVNLPHPGFFERG